ncbi:MAG: PP2C family protein-serine/threonine phosphatase [Clostridiales bacterium]|nr:PP2C family protein-serine/threonine phosphatase [Clostridiales bacterium]
MDKVKGFFVEFKSVFTGENVLKENEEHANVVTATVMMNTFFIAVIICALRIAGLFNIDMEKMVTVAVLSFFILFIPAIVCFTRGGKGKYLKNILLVLLSLGIMLIYSLLTYTATLLIVVPVILASRYYLKKFTEGVAAVSVLLLGFASYAGIKWGLLDINYIVIPEGTEITVGKSLTDSVISLGLPESGIISNIMLQSYVPTLLLYVFIISFACIQVSQSGRKMIDKQKELSEKGARIQTELNLATRIQADMIPQLFPAFPDRPEFDLFATMTPAKEVGGDFYDFFMVDDDHLGLVIADVSGKGVPAALFMMASKSIIQNNALLGKSPAEVLRDTNNSICKNNREDMFVTVWLGILEISTGKLTCANAGHEYPVLCSSEGAFELYKDRHGFVIGGMAGVNYKEYEIALKPGSKLFVYTDGVPEATDANNELFGTDRMLDALNADKKADPQKILTNVRSSVDSFVKDAEQFDDLTMLCLEYKGVEGR